MANPDTLIVEEITVIDSVTVSPVNVIDNIGVNTIPDVLDITIPHSLDVTLTLGDPGQTVQSVNGKVGVVVIDYPDISDTPVNHVRYHHIQSSIPTIQTSGKWNGYYIWTIQHNLNFYPSVTVFDSGNNLIEAYVDYENINTAIIVMNSAISGTAYLS
jgi:hypothetical protein